MRGIVSNMRDQILDNDGSVLVCRFCGFEYSANKDDYFQLPDDYVFHCSECGDEMEILKKKVKVEYSEPNALESQNSEYNNYKVIVEVPIYEVPKDIPIEQVRATANTWLLLRLDEFKIVDVQRVP